MTDPVPLPSDQAQSTPPPPELVRSLLPTIGTPSRLGQATAIEQTRAIAETYGAILVAQQVPRNEAKALDLVRQACSQLSLAERAFYRYPRAGKPVTGPTIHLARELARCWGNVQYGIDELRRDEEFGQSEMKAWAWDVERNSRAAMLFIVPHRRDREGGQIALGDLRDIYENNANMGARRLREQILAILPTWLEQIAKDLCAETLAKGEGGKPLAQTIADMVDAYFGLGITIDQLEAKVAVPRGKWTPLDVAQLRVVWLSVKRGEVTLEDEFPPRRVTGEEIAARHEPPATTEGTGKP